MKRHCPHLPLPAYRYTPGKGPKDEKREDIPKIKIEKLPPERWRKNEAYLYGIDLYQAGFFYEAHEVWEDLWHEVGPKTLQGKFLKALIQLAAANLKRETGNEKAARRFLERVRELLEELRDSKEYEKVPSFMGIFITDLLKNLNSLSPPLLLNPKTFSSRPPSGRPKR